MRDYMRVIVLCITVYFRTKAFQVFTWFIFLSLRFSYCVKIVKIGKNLRKNSWQFISLFLYCVSQTLLKNFGCQCYVIGVYKKYIISDNFNCYSIIDVIYLKKNDNNSTRAFLVFITKRFQLSLICIWLMRGFPKVIDEACFPKL